MVQRFGASDFALRATTGQVALRASDFALRTTTGHVDPTGRAQFRAYTDKAYTGFRPWRDIAAKLGELSTVFFFPLIRGVKVWHRKLNRLQVLEER